MPTSEFERLPTELQLMVMVYLKDQPTLYSMARVNTAWSTYAVNQLWVCPPLRALKVLATLRPKSRQQFLVNKVRRLSLSTSQFAFEGLQFTSLTSLSFGRLAGAEHSNHDSFIQPSLRSLSYYGDHTLTADSMNLIRQRCSDLHSLKVYDTSRLDSGLFVDLLQTLRQLKVLSLGYRIDDRVINDVLACLAAPRSERPEDLTILCPLENIDPSALPRFLHSANVLHKLHLRNLPSNESELLSILCSLDALHDLWLDHHISAEQVSSYLEQYPGSTPFSNVRTLSLQGDAQAIVKLLSSRAITNLTIEVEHPEASFYTAIGSMVQLTSLDVILPPNEVVDHGGIEKLHALINLRRLNFSKSGSDDVLEDMLQLPWVTDELFDKFFANFPLLEQLYLDWDVGSQLTEAAVDALAKHCSLLRRAMLMWHHDLKTWHTLKQPLFLNLESLNLGSICDFTSSKEVSVSLFLCRCADDGQVTATRSDKLNDLRT
jgi:hypothetical protein